MKIHESNFKKEINKMGRQINGKIYYYNNYNLADENNNLLITETNLQLISEQTNYNDKNEINNELIYKISFFQNDSLLKSLMKQFNFEVHFELSVLTNGKRTIWSFS